MRDKQWELCDIFWKLKKIRSLLTKSRRIWCKVHLQWIMCRGADTCVAAVQWFNSVIIYVQWSIKRLIIRKKSVAIVFQLNRKHFHYLTDCLTDWVVEYFKIVLIKFFAFIFWKLEVKRSVSPCAKDVSRNVFVLISEFGIYYDALCCAMVKWLGDHNYTIILYRGNPTIFNLIQ